MALEAATIGFCRGGTWVERIGAGTLCASFPINSMLVEDMGRLTPRLLAPNPCS